MLLAILGLLSIIQQPFQDAVKTVKSSYLDFNGFAPVGLVFEGYRWFEEVNWDRETDQDHQILVIFTGRIDDRKATAVFEKKNKYKFGLALKALRLAPTYGLTESKQKLSFTIRFKFRQDGGFDVYSGLLGVQSAGDGRWRHVPFSDKALLAVVTGIYANRDPYTCLVQGLPYK